MSDYRVKLEIYNGPLDLLLYLIRRSEVEIHDIPIAKITEQYVAYVGLLQQLNIDQAGEFLVMAATLMEIKSAMLLPREQVAEGEEEDLDDPRLELVRQLLEYKKFKDLAGELGESAAEQAARHPRSLADLQRLREELKEEQELDLEAVQIWDLFDAFSRLMQATLAGQRGHEVIHDDTPIDIYETDILQRAQQEEGLTFEAIFLHRSGRGEMVGLFLALLELMRQRLVRVEQERAFGPIYVFALTEEPAAEAVAHAVSAELEHLPSMINRDKKHGPETAEQKKSGGASPTLPTESTGQAEGGADGEEGTED